LFSGRYIYNGNIYRNENEKKEILKRDGKVSHAMKLKLKKKKEQG